MINEGGFTVVVEKTLIFMWSGALGREEETAPSIYDNLDDPDALLGSDFDEDDDEIQVRYLNLFNDKMSDGIY